MPEDSKRNQNKKNKGDAKDQRKPRSPRRQSRNQPNIVEKKEKPDIPKAPEKIVPQEPGPEFYKSLKRETEEILKITEEAHSKYTKKEVLSNWKKYELPIESYDEIEEQENIGADYEQLIQTPMATGGHFQFKHEKNWESAIKPSEYDRFFEIDMQILPIALMSLPFYERNCIDISMFSQVDIANMKNRAMKFKQKYDENKPIKRDNVESDLVSDNITNVPEKSNTIIENILKEYNTEEIEEQLDVEPPDKNVIFDIDDFKVAPNQSPVPIRDEDNGSQNISVINELLVKNNEIIEAVDYNDNGSQNISVNKLLVKNNAINTAVGLDESNDVINNSSSAETNSQLIGPETVKVDKEPNNILQNQSISKTDLVPNGTNETNVKVLEKTGQEPSITTPVIQSSEDLEKWLDDFLDG